MILDSHFLLYYRFKFVQIILIFLKVVINKLLLITYLLVRWQGICLVDHYRGHDAWYENVLLVFSITVSSHI